MATTPRKTPALRSPKRPSTSTEHNQGEEGIQVAIRMRPLNANESSHAKIWKVLPKYNSVAQTTEAGKPLPERVMNRNFFSFDRVFPEDASNEQVYAALAKNIVDSVCNGLNGTIFAYGQTSSGKTFTMQGSGTLQQGADGTGGLVHLAAGDIFQFTQSNDRDFCIKASFLEIYNEEVRDLLNDNKTLQIREDPRRGVFVQSQEIVVDDFAALLQVLFRGEKSRAFASTAMNERSSRSHTIFRITLESRSTADDDDGAVRVSTLNLVDLAGSESVRHTGATGERQKEGGMINTSLLTLSRVIVALGTPNQSHINFRDSRLTRILQPSLSGNARMAVVCCATPSSLYLEETRSTLLFANRAKLVKTNAQVNEVMDDRAIIRRLQRELAEARRFGNPEALQKLQAQAQAAGTTAQIAVDNLKRLHDSIRNGDLDFQEPKRRRRLSVSTPEQKTKLPDTKTTVKPTLTPKTELGLVRQALSHKTNRLDELFEELHAATSRLQGDSSQDALTQIGRLSDEITRLTSVLDTARAEHSNEVEAKDVEMNERLAREAADRRDLEATIDQILSEKGRMEQEMKDLQENLTKTGTEKDQLVEKLDEAEDLAELNATSIQDLNTKVAALESQLQAVTAEREAAKTELESTLESKKTEIQQRDAALERARNEQVVLQEQHTNLQSRFETLSTEHEATVRAKEQADSTVNELTSQLVEHQRQSQDTITGLQTQVDQVTESREQTLAAKEELVGKVAELEATLENRQTEWTEADGKTQAELDSIKVKLDETTEERDILQFAKDEVNARVAVLEAEFARAKEELVASQSLHQSDCERLQGEVDTLRAECSSRTKANFLMITKAEALQVVITQAHKDMETIKSQSARELQRLETTVTELTDSRAELEQVNDELEAKVTKQETALADSQSVWKSTSEKTQQELDDLQSQLSALISERDELGDIQQQLESKVTDLENSLEVARSESDSKSSLLQEERGLLQQQVDELTKERGKLIQSQEDLSAKIAELENAFTATKKELVDSKSTSEEEFARLQGELDVTKSEAQNTELKLSAQVANLQTLLSSVEDELQRSQESKELLQSELVNKDDTIISDGEQHAKKLSEKVTQLQHLQHELEASQGNLSRQEEELELAAGNLAEMKNKVDGLEAKLAETTTELSVVSLELSALKEASSQSEKDLSSKIVEMEEQHSAQLLAAQSKLEAVKTDKETASKEYGVESHRLTQALAEAQETNESLKQVNENTRGEIEQLLKQIDDATTALEERTQDLEASNELNVELKKKLSSHDDALAQEKDGWRQQLKESTDELDRCRDELSSLRESTESHFKSLREEISSLSQERCELKQELAEKEEQLLHGKSATLQQSVLQAQLEESENALAEIRDRMQVSNDALAEANITICDLTEELKVKTSMQSQRATECERMSTDLAEQSEKLTTLTEELDELKSLLADSNAAIDASRAAEAEAKGEATNALSLLETTRQENDSLRKELQTQLEAHSIGTDVTKQLHSDEEYKVLADEVERLREAKSEILRDADIEMNKLRKELESTGRELKTISDEAYNARAKNHDLEKKVSQYRDLEHKLESKAIDSDAKIKQLECSFDEMKHALEAEISFLRAKAERGGRDSTEVTSLRSELSAVNQEYQEVERKLSETNSDLQRQLDATKSELQSKSELEEKLERLAAKLSAKDERIQKLEKNKITKDLLGKIQGWKQEAALLKSENRNLRQQLESLSRASSGSTEGSEISTLTFDHSALKTKYKKCASKKQQLEDERLDVIQALASALPNVDVEKQGMKPVIVHLCDKLSSVEEEVSVMTKPSALAEQEVDKLRAEMKSMRSKASRLERYIEQQKCESGREIDNLKEEVRGLRQNERKLRKQVQAAEADRANQVSSLESENLRVIQDLKRTQTHLERSKREHSRTLEMFKAACQETDTDETGILPISSVPRRDTKTPGKTPKKAGKTPKKARKTPILQRLTSETTVSNKENPAANTSLPGTAQKGRPTRRRGIEDAFQATEENTQECRQS